jgi:outer membrane protein assembly factor BamD (BamD/ComL family)
LALLTQVNAAIQRDDVARAGELLRSYDQRFPSGKLAEERAAAGILVLCASGRTQSASAEARRFVERWPRSPLVARIKASCAAGDKLP